MKDLCGKWNKLSFNSDQPRKGPIYNTVQYSVYNVYCHPMVKIDHMCCICVPIRQSRLLRASILAVQNIRKNEVTGSGTFNFVYF